MRIVYLGAHSILEYDEVRLFHALGHEIFSIGAYIHPSRPLDDVRPALPEVPEVPECIAAVDALGQQGHADTLMAAKDMGLPDAVFDWAEVIICSALEHRWIAPNWKRLKNKRVIWRTIGQAGDRNEAMMAPLRREGMQIVRYSPKERNIPHFAGEDALIRFYKDPDEWYGWTGDLPVVTNISQSLYQRSLADDGLLQPPGYQWTSYQFWQEATDGLRTMPAGPGSEAIGGVGTLEYDSMREHLRRCRAYLFTGTQPASYTLGLIEAMMTGIPCVSIGPEWYRILPYGPQMFEGHEITGWTEQNGYSPNDPLEAQAALRLYLEDDVMTQEASVEIRRDAIALFGRDKIAAQWAAFLEGRELPSDFERFKDEIKVLAAA